MKPLIFGIEGYTLSNQEKDFFTESKPIGFILFGRNLQSKEQISELTKSLKGLFPERKVPILIDQEGGRVARIKPPINSTLFPAASHFAELYEENENLALQETQNNYKNLMNELADLGIDSPCAPMCDMLHKNSDNIIGDRSFGDNVEKIVKLTRAAIHGINFAGGLPIVKHLPGHGRSTEDSHVKLPTIGTNLAELEATDFKIFKELSDEQAWGMTAHIVFDAIDKENPATLSKKVINYIRDKLNFHGKLLTDDLCMYALHGDCGQKHMVLNKVINLINANKAWRDNYSQDLKNMFNINSFQIEDEVIKELCQKNLKIIQPYFLESLVKTSKMSLNAGCDILLHCSGKLDEMQAINNNIGDIK